MLDKKLTIIDNTKVLNHSEILNEKVDFSDNNSQDINLLSQNLIKPVESSLEQAVDMKQVTGTDTGPSYIECTLDVLRDIRCEVKGDHHEGCFIYIYISDIPVPIIFYIPPAMEAYTLLPGVLIVNQISFFISFIGIVGVCSVDIYKAIYCKDKPVSEEQAKIDDEKISDKKLEKTSEENLPDQIDEQSFSKTSESESSGVFSSLFEYISSFF